MTEFHVEVTGWNAENESVAWDGYGATADEAVQNAMQRGGIIEIGDVRNAEVHRDLAADVADALTPRGLR